MELGEDKRLDDGYLKVKIACHLCLYPKSQYIADHGHQMIVPRSWVISYGDRRRRESTGNFKQEELKAAILITEHRLSFTIPFGHNKSDTVSHLRDDRLRYAQPYLSDFPKSRRRNFI